MKKMILEFKDRYVVDVALRSFTSPGPDTVFWSVAKNSYVIVRDPKGEWLHHGEPVTLASVNGRGEIRWTVVTHSPHQGEGAVEHFELEVRR